MAVIDGRVIEAIQNGGCVRPDFHLMFLEGLAVVMGDVETGSRIYISVRGSGQCHNDVARLTGPVNDHLIVTVV